MKHHLGISAVGIVVLNAVFTAAFAQSAANEAPAGASQATDIQEVVVTAQKKAEPAQRVPAAVSVMSGAQLADLGVTDLTQVRDLTSGLSVTPIRTQAVTFMRGVGTTVTTPNADPSVAMNLNGVYLPTEIAGTAFFDVSRIEVVPGPQGTLYGRNSTGGVINIVTRTPGAQLSADGFVEAGNYGRIDGLVGVDVPVTASLASRTAATVIKHNGYFDNGEDDQHTYAARETLVWTPTDRTRVNGSVTYSSDSGVGTILQNVVAPPVPGCLRCLPFDPHALGYGESTDVIEGNLQAEQGLTDAVTLTYIGGYNHLRASSLNSAVAAVAPFFPNPLNVYQTTEDQSHELRLNAISGRLEGILGGYYFDQVGDYYSGLVLLPRPGHIVNQMNVASRGKAVFGQATYSIIDALRLTGGLRYSSTTKGLNGYNATYTGAGTSTVTLIPPGVQPFTGDSTLDRLDWKGGLEYDLNATSMLYASATTGFNAGGFANAQIGAPTATLQEAPPFKPVTVTAYAGGIKNRFANGAITVNAEGFYYDYTNYQVSARSVLTGQNIVLNAAKSTIYGGQLDLHFIPTDEDDFSASVTGLHAVADTLIVPGQDYSGYTLPYAPKWSGYVDYQHSFKVGNGARIAASLNVAYLSGRWALYTHQPGSYINGNSDINLNLSYHPASDMWSVGAWVRNLQDKIVKTSCGNGLPPGTTACFFEPPRTYGVTVTYDLRRR